VCEWENPTPNTIKAPNTIAKIAGTLLVAFTYADSNSVIESSLSMTITLRYGITKTIQLTGHTAKMAGLLAHGSSPYIHLPKTQTLLVQWFLGNGLSADSCGGSHD
tara:strand:+ start:180 stop:497 length:318 start_codon:yes stop_codon:yes gene_type:complete